MDMISGNVRLIYFKYLTAAWRGVGLATAIGAVITCVAMGFLTQSKHKVNA